MAAKPLQELLNILLNNLYFFKDIDFGFEYV